MSAPVLAASAVACCSRTSRPVNASGGSSGGASGSGAMLPSGATTVSWGPPVGAGGVPYTLASHPAVTSHASDRGSAVTISSFDGRRSMALLA